MMEGISYDIVEVNPQNAAGRTAQGYFAVPVRVGATLALVVVCTDAGLIPVLNHGHLTPWADGELSSNHLRKKIKKLAHRVARGE